MTRLNSNTSTNRSYSAQRYLRSAVALGVLIMPAIIPVGALAVPQDGSKKVTDNVQPPYTGPKKRIAIMNKDLDGNTSAHGDWFKLWRDQTGAKDADDVGLKLNTMLTTALQNTGRFVILERQDFGDIKGEQDLASQGQTTTQTGAKKGSILGAEIMVRCAITEFVADSVKEGGGGGFHVPGVSIGGGGSRKKSKVTVDIKMYEVATSKVLYTDTASGDSTSRSSSIGIAGSSGGYGGGAMFGKSTNDPIEKATRDAITNVVNKIIKKMEEIPWEGKVALAEKDDDGKMVYVINRGSADGVKVGDELVITRPGKVIVDPDTGEKLGRSEDKVLGSCRVLSVNKNTANISPVGDIEIKAGAVVKYR